MAYEYMNETAAKIRKAVRRNKLRWDTAMAEANDGPGNLAASRALAALAKRLGLKRRSHDDNTYSEMVIKHAVDEIAKGGHEPPSVY